ncbi:Gfo/Idh/MocA family protein [Bacillus sp. REN16]|uniref:Gfo/Idh/MocA family protein n=1 Tax=Bacillus sp. REN16 TaxID=2887296 RepID=UPI001E5273F3|nr:Gfo/Idh/MocA family oxidoreductase [Bacillus sp. REN16]MCC3355855.1 Gfo/Idh/MocA family oxidoreductase [Bacillus sp. REN16]
MTLKIGLVGTGWFSKMHAGLLSKMDGVKVQAICGSSKEKAELMAMDFNGINGYGRLNEMLEEEKLDAVYICVPPFAHGEIEHELIERGIPFLVEKPLGVDLQTPTSILNEIKKKSLITSVGYHFRYSQSVQHLKEEIENHTIGLISGYWMGGMPKVSWWRNQETSGGQFIEQTTHIVDLLRYIAGEVDEVYAAFGNRVMKEKFDNVTVHDIGCVTMKLKNGVVAQISNSCILPEGVSQVNMTYFTDKGMVTWQPDQVTISASTSKMQKTFRSGNPYLLESEAFLHAVRTGDTSRILSDYHDAFRTQMVTSRALESALSGLPVKINVN